MRLWHKDLISVLPRQQLLGQNRECACMLKDILEKGKVNHILINYVNSYDKNHLYSYYDLVIEEMLNRGYKISDKTFNRMSEFGNEYSCAFVSKNKIFSLNHNKRYLKQCYYNLQEKYDCGGITISEWNKIKEKIND